MEDDSGGAAELNMYGEAMDTLDDDDDLQMNTSASNPRSNPPNATHSSGSQSEAENAVFRAVQEETWSGYRTRQRATVEDVDDEDDPPSQDEAEDEDDWPDTPLPSDRELDDEYTAISVWDELTEGILRSIGCTADDLSEEDLEILRPFALKVDSPDVSDATFKKFGRVFPAAHVSSWKNIQTRVQQLCGFGPERYDCCVNSCCCFVGPHAEHDTCPYCAEARRDSQGRARKTFVYLPLIPRLKAFLANPDMAEKMKHRAEDFEHEPGKMKDVYDSRHYQDLRRKNVVVNGRELPHRFFEDPRDIALGLSTDGFAPFKRRTKTAWPLIVFNYNLPSDLRFKLKYVLGLGVIPGPKKPHDLDSFLWPFTQELLRLAIGVHAYDARSKDFFALRAFLILVFGDIPAISMVMCMKGHNGLSPCRMCEIKGIRIPDSSNPIHYVPLDRSRHPSVTGAEGSIKIYDPAHLPLRTHERLLTQAREVQFARTERESEQLAKTYGIKGVPLLHVLPSLSFPASFPYDFMHLLWENVVKNLMQLWTGQYKGLDTGSEEYEILPTIWEAIGEASENSGDTIPGQFGPRPPNVATDKMSWTADTCSFWIQYVGPVLLSNRFTRRKYYTHFIALVRLLRKCLQYEIPVATIDEIRQGFIQWVKDYEEIYYQKDPQRLAMCPLTVHALLHIADSIEMVGPVWAYWAFAMERYCGSLQPAIRSRRYPYASLNRHVVDRARLAQLKLMYPGLEQKLHFDSSTPAARVSIEGCTYPASCG
ncbi:hypothetical protein GSI_08429 [Ganoderma sinense ZZ0214-1]|uniref:Transposase family Tnp2 protein n=1 Tax=Ganoderma sinense ZZ0214-1 TaxID=1077348 RepID=A0A2G8S6Y3_9APHY|nr:hypothetical protein GSI_08429 [Ganoderma sinense ZZ0214-1]